MAGQRKIVRPMSPSLLLIVPFAILMEESKNLRWEGKAFTKCFFFSSKKSMSSHNADRSNPSSSTCILLFDDDYFIVRKTYRDDTCQVKNIDHNQYVVPSIIIILICLNKKSNTKTEMVY